MTANERRARLQRILNEHDEIARALRESGESFARMRAAFAETLAAADDATAAQRKAIDAILAANRAALALFSEP